VLLFYLKMSPVRMYKYGYLTLLLWYILLLPTRNWINLDRTRSLLTRRRSITNRSQAQMSSFNIENQESTPIWKK
jgi:hypothetical protein